MTLKIVLVCVLIGIVAAESNSDFSDLGKSFDSTYTSIVQSPESLDELRTLYKNDAIIMYDSVEYKGPDKLIEKLKALKINGRTVKSIDTISSKEGHILHLLVGKMKLGDNDPVSFVQMVVFKPDPEYEKWACSEEFFRYT